MSRYTATVRTSDPHAPNETIPCDVAYVDGGGDLHLNRLRGGGDSLTIARFQHGHWSSYELEPTAEPDVEAWLREGVMTREQFLRRAQGESADARADAPVKAEARPEVGSIVHLWSQDGTGFACTPMYVTAYRYDGAWAAALLLSSRPGDVRFPDVDSYLSLTHDENRTVSGSWHYPCDGDDRDAAPKPDAPAPVSVTFNFDTPVLNERWLRESVDRALRQATSTAAWTLYKR